MIIKRRWPWIAQQNWEDILFIHTPVAYDVLRTYVPYPFEIDLYNNKGWASIVLFRAKHSRPRFVPSFLSFPPFYQMNIRTYVNFGNERGIYFLKIYVNSRAVKTGGNIAGLPFKKANIIMDKDDKKLFFHANHLIDHQESSFCVSYVPKTLINSSHSNGLSYFLTERYTAWMIRGSTIIKAPIYHTHWNLKEADIKIHECKQIPFITDNSIAYYTKFKHARIYPFELIGKTKV